MIEPLAVLCAVVYAAYAWPTMLLDVSRWRRPDRKIPLLTRLRMETKPFRYVALVGTYAPDILGGRLSWWEIFWLTVGLIFCYITRHDKDDDDRWKRRREKLASKVAQVGGRLQVVPVGGES